MILEAGTMVRDLVAVTAPWHALFSRSAPLEMGVVGTQVLSMLVAGGLAIAHDRGTLRADRWTAPIRRHHFSELHAVHRTVVVALAICMLSGLALFAADVKNYVGSVPFWIKMSLITLLLTNAIVMTKAEPQLRVAPAGGGSAAALTMRTTSIVSVALWATIVLVSIVLSLSK
jgi:hypothetical protein